MLRLIGTDGSKYYSWDLKPGKYVVGRKAECDFFITNGTISRRHAELEVAPDMKCYLTDLGSHNGTVINSTPVTNRVPVEIGDTIGFGEAEFRITDRDEPGSGASKPMTTKLAQKDPEKSVLLSINEALKPLPSKVTELPEVLSTIFEMARTQVLQEPQEDMLGRALELISRVIPAERLAVLTTTVDQKEVYLAASHLPQGKDPGELTLSRTIIDDILTNKNSILISDPMADPHFAQQQSIISSALKSAMAVPMFDEGKVLGILYVDTTHPLHKYNDDYLKLLATFGNIIASRLLNYALLTERAEKQVMEAELKRASSIQKRLLDIPCPEVPGYKIHAYQEQCRAVGGDLYDMCLLCDGSLVFMVADVSGKGMGAALLMSNILASFRILYHESQESLAGVVNQVSSQLFSYSAPEDFATLFVGLLNPEKNSVIYVNAGHNPPLLIRQDGTISQLEASGIMIGAFPSMEWGEARIDINPGDSLVIYTDGVTEAEHEEEQYGETRLEEVVTSSLQHEPHEIGNQLMADIDKFVGDSPQSDDITMMVLKRNQL